MDTNAAGNLKGSRIDEVRSPFSSEASNWVALKTFIAAGRRTVVKAALKFTDAARQNTRGWAASDCSLVCRTAHAAVRTRSLSRSSRTPGRNSPAAAGDPVTCGAGDDRSHFHVGAVSRSCRHVPCPLRELRRQRVCHVTDRDDRRERHAALACRAVSGTDDGLGREIEIRVGYS